MSALLHGDFLAGGGEMGARMRALDWSRTPLGPVESWPQSLRSAVSILLPSKAQIALFWGPELITLYNDAYRPVFGGKHPQALGQPIREAWSELWGAGLKELFENVLVTGEAFWAKDRPFYMERHGYAEETFFDVSYDPVRDESGRVGGVFCIVSETTGRVVNERRLALLRDLAARNSMARSAREACALAMEALAAKPQDIPYAAAYLGGELQACTPGERPARTEQLSLGAVGTLVVGINPQRPFDDKYREFLDLVAGQLATAIANACAYEEERKRAEALAEIDRAKTAFFSNVSHEFRTPLTLMLGPLADGLADREAPLPAPQRERQELVLRSALRLQKLVNTLLDFSRIEAGRAQASYVATDLGGFTANLAATFRSAVEKAGLELAVDCPALPEPAYIDREMWEKIVLNLLSNAFKFTFEGRIALSVRLERDFVLEVRDTGVGIPPAELPRIFERFHRVEGAKSRTHEGSGIGLALVRELVTLHGGSVQAESVEGKGSVFTVSVPRGRLHLPQERVGAPPALASTALGPASFVQEALGWLSEPEPSPAPAQAGAQPRVVWADDNADMREYVTSLLAPRYEVEAVADGEAALAAARRRRPDLVLSDVMMPRLDGLGLARALRADEKLRDVPLILLSARAGEEARIEGLGAGADQYLQKPFSARELLARVDALLQVAKLRAEARASRGELADFIENATVAMHWVGPDGTILWANRAELEMMGCAPHEYIGRPIAEFHADQEVIEDILARLRRDEKLDDYPARMRRKDGAIRHVLINSSVLWKDGKFIHTRCFTRDITELRQAQEELSRELAATRRLQETSVQLLSEDRPEVLYERLLDAAVAIMRSDFASIQMLDPERGELKLLGARGLSEQDRKRWEWVGPAAGSSCALAMSRGARMVIEDIERADFMPSEVVEAYLGAGIRAAQSTPLVSRGGKLQGMISTHWREPRRLAEHELRLFDVLARQAADLIERSRIQRQLVEADRRKDEFLAMLSHELRNPLAPIANAVSLLREPGLEPQLVAQAHGILERQVAHLIHLVDDLLDLARISRGAIGVQKQRVSVAQVVAAAVETSRPLVEAGAHQLVVRNAPPSALVTGDPVRLAQVVSNLLNNAAKYTPRGGRIELEAGVESGFAFVTVRDNGMGIAPDELPRVFELFTQREETRRRAPGGLGVGLALARQLAELHGGTLEGASEGAGRGAQFTLRVPLCAEGQAAQAAADAAPASPPPRRILLVDDNADAAEGFAAHLRRQGHEVRVAADGEQALAVARDFRPQVALVDIALPGMSGYEVAHRLRSTPALLIALTGHGQKQDRARAEQAGFHHHFVKPADPRDIQAAIGAWRSP